jgi:transposase-like protein
MSLTSVQNELKVNVAVELSERFPSFKILHKDGKVYSEIFHYCAKSTQQAIVRARVFAGSVIHSDCWRGYKGLVDIGYKKHYPIHHSNDEFANGKKHIIGIISFCSFSKSRLLKFNGNSKTTFCLQMKESEFMINYRNENI